jgi:4-hydroxythreonine-4-phosphate dehydrogenase
MAASTPLLRIALTPGEPAGIGPDLAVRIAQHALPVELVMIADPTLLTRRATRLGLPLSVRPYRREAEPLAQRPGEVCVLPVPLAAAEQCGKLNPANAAYVLRTLQTATESCLRGELQALVTGPVHKGVINDSGRAFSGHTEYLAELSDTPTVVMMLMAKNLRVALVTTHLPLADVPRAITAAHLEQILRTLHRDLRRQLGIATPRILVCGLNPHAGESGHLGQQEQTIIEPVLAKLRQEGLVLHGPVPADTAFIPKRLQHADVVLTMYHDQGLPVLKYAGFGEAINMTLGLPFVRTSVDHGTALELAGTGEADCSSLLAAIDVAIAAATTLQGRR